MEKKKRGTDESVEMPRSHLHIEPEAEQNPPQREMDERYSSRLSADLPYGLPTDDMHPTGTPQNISSGFSDLRRGDMPDLEDRGAHNRRGIEMNDDTKQKGSSDPLDEMRKEPTYDAEKEIPDPDQVEKDIQEAEKTYGDKSRKSA